MRCVVLFSKDIFLRGLVCISLNSRPPSSHRALKKNEDNCVSASGLRFGSFKRSFRFDLSSRSS